MTPSDTDALMAGAAAVIGGQWHGAVRLHSPELLKDASRAIVLRCHLAGAAAPWRTLIVKAIRDDNATGFSEWASLAFLTALPTARGLAPHFIGGDVERRLFVLEDLGAGHTLDAVLTEGDPADAEAMLRELARQMARLHAVTIGREAEFLHIRRALPAATNHGRRREAEQWRSSSPRIAVWFTATGIEPPAGFEPCLDQIAARYAHPGDWLAFTHGDPAPSNNHSDGQSVRLLDFEYGAFRHALYDISAWNILCPLPAPAVALMRRAFQATLAAAMPLAGDDQRFAGEWAALCAYRALALLTWVDPSVLHANRPFVGAWTARHALLAALTRLCDATAISESLGPITTSAARLANALHERWPEFQGCDEIATDWPALRGYGTSCTE